MLKDIQHNLRHCHERMVFDPLCNVDDDGLGEFVMGNLLDDGAKKLRRNGRHNDVFLVRRLLDIGEN